MPCVCRGSHDVDHVRHLRHGRCHRIRQFTFDRSNRSEQFLCVGLEAPFASQCLYPASEVRFGDRNHHVHRTGDGAFFFKQAIEYPLDFVGDVAQLGQADHATAALQGMETATDRPQRFAVAGISCQRTLLFGHVVQHFGRLEQINFEQLAVELACIRGQQPPRFIRNSRRRC